jgi:hypothetical protein
MPDTRPTFRATIIRAYTVRTHISTGHYRQALAEVETLRADLEHLPDCPPVLRGADPAAVANSLVGHAEAGSPFGMMLEALELESLLGRIVADGYEGKNAEGEVIDHEPAPDDLRRQRR